MIRVKNLSFGVHAVLSDLPPLLLVQGLLSSRNHWLPNTDALRSRFRLVIAELPGHGRSSALIDGLSADRVLPRASPCGTQSATQRR